MHSNVAGFGLKDIPKTKRSWVLLGWKINLQYRPEYAENITIKTWSRGMDKVHAYRDFEIFVEGKCIGIATSKWVLIDTEKGKIVRLTDEISNAYEIEEKQVFEARELEKLIEPEEFLQSTTFFVTKNMIDVNKHVHNIYFMDIANEVLPAEAYEDSDLNNIEIMYKKQIRLGDTVRVFYSEENGIHTVTIKSFDCKNLHAIVKLSK